MARLGTGKTIAHLVKETFVQWKEDKASRLAAALSFYAVLSLSPLIVIMIAVAGLVFGEAAAKGQLSQQVGEVVGPTAGQAIQALVNNARSPAAGVASFAIGILVLLFGASGVFGELQASLNQIWNVKPRPGRGLRGVIRDRSFSFAMVLAVALLLMVSLVLSAVLAASSAQLERWVPFPELWRLIQISISLAISTLLFSLMFKVIPDARIAWRDVWVGGLVTAILFAIGQSILAWYVGRSATVSPYGAAGSLVALIVWIYYSAQIVFLGAEFAQVYATRFGSSIEPSEQAVAAEKPTVSRKPAREPRPISTRHPKPAAR